jgi:hypothetical protein
MGWVGLGWVEVGGFKLNFARLEKASEKHCYWLVDSQTRGRKKDYYYYELLDYTR